MDLSHDVNFNDPLELKELYRDEKGEEYAGMSAVCWEHIRCIEEYFRPDDWKRFPGPKYYIVLFNTPVKLILGDYESLLRHWKYFRNKYPTFVDRGDYDPFDDEDND